MRSIAKGLALLAAALCIAGFASADPVPPTNMDLVFATVDSTIAQALGDVTFPVDPAGNAPGVWVASEAPHDANWLVEHLLARRLLDRGLTATFDQPASDSNHVQLAYNVLELSTTGETRMLRAKVQRRCRADLALTLSDVSDHAVHWRREASVTHVDAVPKRRLDLLANAQYSFAKTELEEQTWGKFVEPVVISSVLGGLIYLFFSNR